jgi:hypothetical protein
VQASCNGLHARSHVYHVAQHSDKAASEERYPSTVLSARKISHGDLTTHLAAVATRQDYSTRCKAKHAVHVALSQSLSLSLVLMPDRSWLRQPAV